LENFRELAACPWGTYSARSDMAQQDINMSLYLMMPRVGDLLALERFLHQKISKTQGQIYKYE
jgi:hypothetical protein